MRRWGLHRKRNQHLVRYKKPSFSRLSVRSTEYKIALGPLMNKSSQLRELARGRISVQSYPSCSNRGPAPCCCGTRITCSSPSRISHTLSPTQLHLFPPPWALQKSVLPWALFPQFSYLERFPPPCLTQQSVRPRALFVQPGTAHRLPPPWDTQNSVPPCTLLVQIPPLLNEHCLPPPCLAKQRPPFGPSCATGKNAPLATAVGFAVHSAALSSLIAAGELAPAEMHNLTWPSALRLWPSTLHLLPPPCWMQSPTCPELP